MKIGIISDTHGIVPAWEQAMQVFQGVDVILHAGDVLYHPPKKGCTEGYHLLGLVKLMNSSPVPIVVARGNCDAEVYEELLTMPVLAPYALVEFDGLRIVIQHGQNLNADSMAGIIEKYHADVFVTGHTHLPVIERVGKAIHINPGSPSHTKFEYRGNPTPTVGMIADGHIRVLALATGEEIMSLALKL
jgi:hypothetical protein